MNYQYMTKRLNVLTRDKITCKCGHRVLLGRQDRIICSFCNRYVYKNKEIEFKYKLLEKKRRQKVERGIRDKN